MRGCLAALALAVLLLLPRSADAEWHFKPFIGLAFAGDTTFLDFEQAAGDRHWSLGVSGVWLGEILGVEGDLGVVPGFFQADDSNLSERGLGDLVLLGRVTTITGSVVVAAPRRLTRYTLRPYLLGGFGVMRVRVETRPPTPFLVDETLPALNLGGGATGFLSERVGVSWELRHLRTVGRHPADPITTVLGADKQLSFWRASMALAIRY